MLSNGEAGVKTVALGANQAGQVYRDFLGHRKDRIVADDTGTADFPVHGGSVSVWVREDLN